MLAAKPWCVWCGAPASVADHQPPLSMFPHPSLWEGVLVSSCVTCSAKQGAQVRHRPGSGSVGRRRHRRGGGRDRRSGAAAVRQSPASAPADVGSVAGRGGGRARVRLARLAASGRRRVPRARPASWARVRSVGWRRVRSVASPGARPARRRCRRPGRRCSVCCRICRRRRRLVGIDGDPPAAGRLSGAEPQRGAGPLAGARRRADGVASWPCHVEKVVLQRGDEAIRFVNGSRYTIVTPSRTAARGMAADLLIIDEAMAHDVELLAVVSPTMAQRDTAVGSIGSPVGRRVVGRRHPLARCWPRSGSWAGGPSSRGTPAGAGSSGRVPDDADVLDEDVWRATIPTLGQRDGIGLEYLRLEAESLRAGAVRPRVPVPCDQR